MRQKQYDDYDHYVSVQKSKTMKPSVRTVHETKFDLRKRKFVVDFIYQLSDLVPVKSKVLCLGARRGEEVVAFQELGYDAIGVDLVATSPYVIEADFHDLPFEDSSFDLIFSNSVDHVFDLEKFTSEIRRVIRPGGIGLFRFSIGRIGDRWASLEFDTAEEFLVYFSEYEIVKNETIKRQDVGIDQFVILRKKTAGDK